jgi:hypothetical protein
LKAILDKVAEEDYKSKRLEIEQGLERFKSFLLKIAKVKRWALTVWVEGSKVKDLEKFEKDLNLLEREGHRKRTDEIHRTQRIPRVSTNAERI